MQIRSIKNKFMKKGDLFILGIWIVLIIVFPRNLLYAMGIVSLLGLWALISVARTEKDAGYKIIWAFISLVLPLLGPTLYYILEVRKRGSKIWPLKKPKKK